MKAAFVGNGYHLKYTKSSLFFIEFLKETWPGLRVISEEWAWARLPDSKPWDLLVFWQMIPPRLLLEAISVRHPVLVPMYDDCPKEKSFWDQYLGCSVVCFSRALADLLEPWGHRVFRARFFPEPSEVISDWSRGPARAFFWPRKPNLGWSTVKILLGDRHWEGVHLHVTEPDPTLTEGLTEEDRSRFAVTQTKWFRNKLEYKKAVGACQVFFAPRRTEGIGMSFLEAMAMGLAVAAPNGSTMNEYVVPGENGWLYDPDAPAPLTFERAADFGVRARQNVIEGRLAWVRSLGSLRTFLTEPRGPLAPVNWGPGARDLRKDFQARYLWYLVLEPLRIGKRLIYSLLYKEK